MYIFFLKKIKLKQDLIHYKMSKTFNPHAGVFNLNLNSMKAKLKFGMFKHDVFFIFSKHNVILLKD